MTQKSYFGNLWIWKYFESLTKVELQKTLIVNFRHLKVFCMHVIFLAFNMTPLPNGQFTNVSSKNRLRIFSRIQMVANIFLALPKTFFFLNRIYEWWRDWQEICTTPIEWRKNTGPHISTCQYSVEEIYFTKFKTRKQVSLTF